MAALTSGDRESAELSESKKTLTWKRKATLALGVGVPLGVLALTDPAAAFDNFSTDFTGSPDYTGDPVGLTDPFDFSVSESVSPMVSAPAFEREPSGFEPAGFDFASDATADPDSADFASLPTAAPSERTDFVSSERTSLVSPSTDFARFELGNTSGLEVIERRDLSQLRSPLQQLRVNGMNPLDLGTGELESEELSFAQLDEMTPDEQREYLLAGDVAGTEDNSIDFASFNPDPQPEASPFVRGSEVALSTTAPYPGHLLGQPAGDTESVASTAPVVNTGLAEETTNFAQAPDAFLEPDSPFAVHPVAQADTPEIPSPGEGFTAPMAAAPSGAEQTFDSAGRPDLDLVTADLKAQGLTVSEETISGLGTRQVAVHNDDGDLVSTVISGVDPRSGAAYVKIYDVASGVTTNEIVTAASRDEPGLYLGSNSPHGVDEAPMIASGDLPAPVYEGPSKTDVVFAGSMFVPGIAPARMAATIGYHALSAARAVGAGLWAQRAAVGTGVVVAGATALDLVSIPPVGKPGLTGRPIPVLESLTLSRPVAVNGSTTISGETVEALPESSGGFLQTRPPVSAPEFLPGQRLENVMLQAAPEDDSRIEPDDLVEVGESAVTTISPGITEADSANAACYFCEVEIVTAGGDPLGEFDGIDLARGVFVEEKAVTGLDRVNPRTGARQQTPADWAERQIVKKTDTRIRNLGLADTTRPAANDTTVPHIDEIRDIRSFEFRLEGDSPELREAVEPALDKLRTTHPSHSFDAKYGSRT